MLKYHRNANEIKMESKYVMKQKWNSATMKMERENIEDELEMRSKVNCHIRPIKEKY